MWWGPNSVAPRSRAAILRAAVRGSPTFNPKCGDGNGRKEHKKAQKIRDKEPSSSPQRLTHPSDETVMFYRYERKKSVAVRFLLLTSFSCSCSTEREQEHEQENEERNPLLRTFCAHAFIKSSLCASLSSLRLSITVSSKEQRRRIGSGSNTKALLIAICGACGVPKGLDENSPAFQRRESERRG